MPRKPITPKVGPDDFNCKRCGKVVRYATIKHTSQRYGVQATFDVPEVIGGGYQLTEATTQIQGETVATGEWIADYTRVAERKPRGKGFRRHNCKPLPVPVVDA